MCVGQTTNFSPIRKLKRLRCTPLCQDFRFDIFMRPFLLSNPVARPPINVLIPTPAHCVRPTIHINHTVLVKSYLPTYLYMIKNRNEELNREFFIYLFFSNNSQVTSIILYVHRKRMVIILNSINLITSAALYIFYGPSNEFRPSGR